MCKANTYKLMLIMGFVMIRYGVVLAQQSVDCDKMLKQEINMQNSQQILNDMKQIDCFGLDSIDLKIFGNGPVLVLF